MNNQSSDRDIRELYLRNTPSVDGDEIWEAVRRRLPAMARLGKRASRARPWSGLRVAIYASIAVVLVAAVALGSLEVVKYLGKQDFVLRITDDTNIGTGGPTTPTEPQRRHWAPLLDLHTALSSMGSVKWTEPNALAIDPSDPSILYAGAYEGLFKSTDGAKTWHQLPTLSGQVYMIGIDPVSPSTVYAGALLTHANLLRSDDGGLTWVDVSVPEGPSAYDWGIWFDATTTPSTVYVIGGSNIWRSIDRGGTWSPPAATDGNQAIADARANDSLSSTFSNKPLPAAQARVLEELWKSLEGKLTVDSIVFDPSEPLLYAATSVGIVRVGMGLGNAPEQGPWDLIIGVGGRSSVVVGPYGTLYAWTPAGLFRSSNGGDYWTRRAGVGLISTPAAAGVAQGELVLVGADNPDIVFAVANHTLFRSSDGGDTWSTLPDAGAVEGDLVGDPKNSSVLFAISEPGRLFKSADMGTTWTDLVPEGWMDPVVSVAVDPRNGSAVYAVQRQTTTGVSTLSRSLDGGATWETVDSGGLAKYIQQLLFDPRTPDTIYVVCGKEAKDESLYRSADGGATWQNITGELSGKGIAGVQIDSTSGGGLFALTSAGIFQWVQSGEAVPSTAPAVTTTEPVSTTTEAAGETPVAMFRGNLERTGVYPSGGPSQLPAVLWKFLVASGRNEEVSSSAISDGVIYFGSHFDNDDGYLYAVDLKSGKEKWRFLAAGGVVSAPATAAGMVYVGSGNGFLYAVDMESGKERWKLQTGDAIWSSPAIVDGVVYSGCETGYFYAVDAQTGHEKWNIKTGGNVHSSPAVKDGIVYFGSADTYLYAVDAKTGREKWKFKTAGSLSSPAISDGVIYVGSADGLGYPSNTQGGHLCAVDIQSGQEKWQFDAHGAVTDPAVAGGVVYVGSDDGYLYAVDSLTGQEKWSFDAGRGYFGVQSSPSVSGDLVYFGAGGTRHLLYALDINTGQERWKLDTFGVVSSSPVISGGVIYFGSDDGYLWAVK